MIHRIPHPIPTLSAMTLLAPVVCTSDSDITGPTFTCNPIQVDSPDFAALGAQQPDTLTVGEVSISGSAAVNVLAINGLGIVGGVSNDHVDGEEFIRFTFASGPADSVTCHVSVARNGHGDGSVGDATIEAFNNAGASLGDDSATSGRWLDVSERFNHIPLSSSWVTARAGHFRMRPHVLPMTGATRQGPPSRA